MVRHLEPEVQVLQHRRAGPQVTGSDGRLPGGALEDRIWPQTDRSLYPIERVGVAQPAGRGPGRPSSTTKLASVLQEASGVRTLSIARRSARSCLGLRSTLT